jgi:hypothetical protein
MLRRDPNDKTDPNAPVTLFEIARTGLVLDDASGRYAQDTRVVGSTQNAGSVYPAASVAQSNPVPPEEPLGESVDDVIPVGTASLRQKESER